MHNEYLIKTTIKSEREKKRERIKREGGGVREVVGEGATE